MLIEKLAPSQEFGVRASTSKVQRQSRTPRWHCEGWFRILRSICWAGIISITNDGCNRHGHQRVHRTSSRRSILLHPGQNGRCTDVIENSKVRMSRYLDTSTDTRMVKIMAQYGRPCCSSWTESVRSFLWQDFYGNGNLTKFYWNTVGRKFHIGECLFVNRDIRTVLISVCGPYQTGWEKKQNINPTWQILMKDVDLGESTSFLDHVYFGLHSTRMSNQQGYCG